MGAYKKKLSTRGGIGSRIISNSSGIVENERLCSTWNISALTEITERSEGLEGTDRIERTGIAE